MNNRENKKKEPWRIILFIISLLFIVFMWAKNDILAIYTSVPAEETLPLILTTLAVSLLKVFVIAGGVLLIKWLIGKAKNK